MYIMRRKSTLPLTLLILFSAAALHAMKVEGASSSDQLGIGPSPGPAAGSPADPAAAPPRDSLYWPQGYYPGDPIPARTIYLTFDDGPGDFTAQILDILKEENVRATFFLNSYDKDNPFHADTGQNFLFRYADVLKRMVDEGHAIGNHTYSHRDLAALSPAQAAFQLDTLQRQLGEVLGDKMPRIYLLRPPFGSPWLGNWNTRKQKAKVRSELKDRGIVMLWTTGWDSSDSVDWASGEWYEASAKRYHPGSASYELKMKRESDRILKRADGIMGGIVLMHDTHPTSRDVLKSLIEELKARGYGFDTLENYCRWRWGAGVFARFDPPLEAPKALGDAQPGPPAPSEDTR
jgi:peptidoglycan/xylan/chitin deacetylase (PgdA/CDA1 family)